MIYSVEVEFRGYEERTSQKSGNKFLNIFCEDLENGQAIKIPVFGDSVSSISSKLTKLNKGCMLSLSFNKHADWNGSSRDDIFDIEEVG